MADEDFHLSVRRTQDGVLVELQSPSQSADIYLTDDQAAKLAWQAVRAAFPLDVSSLEDLQNISPKAQIRPLALAWGAVEDGDLALTVFLQGIQPIAIVLSDEQAQSVRVALEQSLRIPRELRITKSKN